jgi:serpin B
MRMWGTVAAGLAVVLMSAACGSSGQAAPAGPAALRAAGVVRAMPGADAPVAAVAAGITGLGYRLGQGETGNWVVSPASISFAFAMARAGAGGDTAAELDRAFGFPAAGLGDAFNAITRQLVTADIPPPVPTKPRQPGEVRPTVVCLGDALFPQSGYPIGDAFLHTLAEQYGAGVYPVDFGQPAAKGQIDDWVNAQTAGRIPKLFDRLDPATKLVLANTVYLRADWAHPFEPESTGDEAFHRSGGTDVTVKMMHLGAQLRYAQGDGWRAVELPYLGGQLALRVLLPTSDRVSPHDLLAPDLMAAVGAGLAPTGVALSLPKWDITTEVPLADRLRALGVVSAFTDRADFSGIHTGLFIDQAVHRATMTVDEAGTEAAAATGIAMVPTSGMLAQQTVTVDRPFAFAIVHTGTGVPVFVGQVADPAAKAS